MATRIRVRRLNTDTTRDPRNVNRSGDTLTGPLSLPADPTDDAHAVRRGWANARLAERVARTDAVIDGLMTHTGAVSKRSNQGREWRWRQGNANGDTAWKLAATITIPSGTFRAVQMEVTCRVGTSSYGATAQRSRRTYTVSAHRSAAVDGDADNGTVNGPDADHVRLMRTALGVYELHIRAGSGGFVDYGWRIQPHASTSNTDALIAWAAIPPSNAGSGGTIYTATVNAANADVVEALAVAPGGSMTVGANGALTLASGATATLGGDPTVDLHAVTLAFLNRRIPVYATRAAAQAASIPATVTVIYVAGFAAANDRGGMHWRAIGSQPSHTATFQSADGRWWTPAEREVNVIALGGVPFGGDAIAAFEAMSSFAKSLNGLVDMVVPAGTFVISRTWVLDFSNARVRGDGQMSVIRNTNPTQDAVRFESPTPASSKIFSCRIEKVLISVASGTDHTAGAALKFLRADGSYESVTLLNHYIGLHNIGSNVSGTSCIVSAGETWTSLRAGSAGAKMESYTAGNGTEAIGTHVLFDCVGATAAADGLAVLDNGIYFDSGDTIDFPDAHVAGAKKQIYYGTSRSGDKIVSCKVSGYIEGLLPTGTPRGDYGVYIGDCAANAAIYDVGFEGKGLAFREAALYVNEARARNVVWKAYTGITPKKVYDLVAFHSVSISGTSREISDVTAATDLTRGGLFLGTAAADSMLTLDCTVSGRPFPASIAGGILRVGAGMVVSGYLGTIVGRFDALFTVVDRIITAPAATINLDSRSGRILRRQSTSATPVTLTTDGAAPAGDNAIWARPQPNTTVARRYRVVARQASTGDSAEWDIPVLERRGADNASYSLAGGGAALAPTRTLGSSTAWRVALTADTVNGGPAFALTGEASKTIDGEVTEVF